MPARESVARALEQSGGKWTEESVDAAMHLLDKALGMPSDYMEAVPQRAVNMSEWEYAVLPKGLKKNKEVTDALKANGIQPIWHDGTEEGRKAALAGLVNEPTVSFNIAGANEQDAYAAERAEIERAARANGTWLKAPNGEESKLTQEQWTAVRTRAFKRWFGDWEKDPEHASRVVDENGEPLVVYHGTRRGGFRVFRTEGRGKTSDTGAFFSSSRDNAEGYAMNEDGEVPKDMLYEVFLNIREPETVDFKGNNWNRVPDRPVGYIVKFKSGDTEWYDNRDEAESAADMYESDPGTVEEDWGDEDNSYTLDDLAREVREEGYSDGLIAENIIDHAATGRRVSKEPATDYIVFDPKQIKSATDNVGTYDAGNADITLAMTRGAEDALEILRKRETEREGERLIREWQKQCELWSRLGGTDDAKIGKGSRIFGEMMALVSATKGVLPPEYTRMRGLGMSLQWAEIYADMANSGEVPMRGEMKDIVVDVEGAFKTYFEHVPDFGIISSEDMVEMSEEVRGRRHHSTGVSV